VLSLLSGEEGHGSYLSYSAFGELALAEELDYFIFERSLVGPT
jgi:hypothetical protein